jgi:hypothetical protein
MFRESDPAHMGRCAAGAIPPKGGGAAAAPAASFTVVWRSALEYGRARTTPPSDLAVAVGAVDPGVSAAPWSLRRAQAEPP